MARKEWLVLTQCFAAVAILPVCWIGIGLPPVCAEVPQGRFVDPQVVLDPTTSDPAYYPVVSSDGLELYFRRDVNDNPEIWVATRENVDQMFTNARAVTGVNSPSNDNTGGISADGLTLYFGSERGGNFNMYQATRADLNSPFGNVRSLGPGVNTSILDNMPFVSPDGLSMYYHRSTYGGSSDHRLWTATRPDTKSIFGNAMDLGDAVNGNPTADSWKPTVSTDGLTVFFSDGFFGLPRPGGQGGMDIWVSYRESTEDSFGVPVNLNDLWPGTEVNTQMWEGMAYISPDWPAVGSKIYYSSLTEDTTRIMAATWVPEPSAFTLLCLAAGCLAAGRRRVFS